MSRSILLGFLMLWGSVLHGAVMVGWEAEFDTKSHGVRGTVTIQDQNTLGFENFTFDGGGPAVYFYLTDDLGNVESGFILGSLLSGNVYFEESFTLDLDAGKSISDFSAISVWCADFDVDFGSGEFLAPVPEVSANLIFSWLVVSFGLVRRRRNVA